MNNDQKLKDQTWKRMEFVLYAGIGMVCLISLQDWKTVNTSEILSRVGIGLLIGGASLSAGGFFGFIFGIPSLLQNPALDTDKATTLKYNDNLVQISDWLTKIIVGVGLTQLNNIPKSVMSLGTYLSPNFGGDAWGRNASLAIVFYFLLFGFLMIYFWTRTDFTTIMNDTDIALSQVDIINKKIDENKKEQDNKLKLSELNNRIERFEGMKNKIINSENNFDGLKDIFKVFKPGPIKWIDDIQKNRWDGSAEVNGIKLYAEFTDSQESFEEHRIYTVSLYVAGSPDHSLQGKVYFFLHQSYMPNHLVVVEAVNNVAGIQIESYEAFTVGAVCENGNTVLELNMNDYPGSPADYTYPYKLESIDELLEQKALLLKAQG